MKFIACLALVGLYIQLIEATAHKKASGFWKNNIIPFSFAKPYDDNIKQPFLAAVSNIGQCGCINYVASEGEKDHVVFEVSDDGCWSGSVFKDGPVQIVFNNEAPHCSSTNDSINLLGRTAGFEVPRDASPCDVFAVVGDSQECSGLNLCGCKDKDVKNDNRTSIEIRFQQIEKEIEGIKKYYENMVIIGSVIGAVVGAALMAILGKLFKQQIHSMYNRFKLCFCKNRRNSNRNQSVEPQHLGVPVLPPTPFTGKLASVKERQ